MDYPLRNDKTLAGLKIDGAILEIDDEVPLEDKEELIVFLMLMPVILALQDAETYDRVVYLAESLVVPAMCVCTDERGDVDNTERREFDIEERGIGVVSGVRHVNLLSPLWSLTLR